MTEQYGAESLMLGTVKEHRGAVFQMGARSYVGPGTTVHLTTGITIGDDVMIAAECLIMDTDMHALDWEYRRNDVAMTIDAAKGPKDWTHVRCLPVQIDDRAWIGARCIILAGAHIGEGAVIGAGSVVRGYIAPYTLVAGNPAVVLRRLEAVA